MSKDYLCKECKHNNNGWCKKLKYNGLKLVEECKQYVSSENQIAHENNTQTEELKNESYRVLGERLCLYNIQRQIIAIDNKFEEDNTIDRYEKLKDAVYAIGTTIQISEKVFNVDEAIESIIDRDCVEASRKINNMWKENIYK